MHTYHASLVCYTMDDTVRIVVRCIK
ncbi:hypothetical protein KIPB_015581, partial [Kipferlia bialata]|eukprot:g15581.t1